MQLIVVDTERYLINMDPGVITESPFRHLGTAAGGGRIFVCLQDMRNGQVYIEEYKGKGLRTALLKAEELVYIDSEELHKELTTLFSAHDCLRVDIRDFEPPQE